MKKQYHTTEASKICSNCKKKIFGYPAISRKDNKTHICSSCGIQEAVQDFINAIRNTGKSPLD